MDKLSVIIPTYWNSDLCLVHVRECMNSSRIPDEIIVVNDGGDPELEERLKNIERKTKIIYAKINEDITWGYNMACNVGFWVSRGDIISIEDVDHIPHRDAYKNGLFAFNTEKDIDRVCFSRNWVQIEDVLSKPYEEWKIGGSLGPNQMVSMLRREMYVKMKGQDERFCGEYGWMAYDFASRYKRMEVKSRKVGHFYIVKNAEEKNMDRTMSVRNRGFYRENSRLETYHSKYGILNCTFSIKEL